MMYVCIYMPHLNWLGKKTYMFAFHVVENIILAY